MSTATEPRYSPHQWVVNELMARPLRCSSFQRYTGMVYPRCNNGQPCIACLAKFHGSQGKKDKTQIKFERYHSNNPHVYKLMVHLAYKAKAAGAKHYSIWAVASVARWQYVFEVKGTEDFKLSNDYLSRYSRLIMEQEPALADFFTTKALKGQSCSI